MYGFDFLVELPVLFIKDILGVSDLLQLSFSRFVECNLVVDNILQLVDKLPYLPGGDPSRDLPRRIVLIILSSLPCNSR